MQIREANNGDLTRLARLYEASVRALGPQRYTPEQIEAWATFARNRTAFTAKFADALCLAAEDNGEIAGFVTLEPVGVIGLLYVHPDRARQGVGSALLTAAIDRARQAGIERLTTIASQFSRLLFERHGFAIYQTENADHNGAIFHRYLMQRDLR